MKINPKGELKKTNPLRKVRILDGRSNRSTSVRTIFSDDLDNEFVKFKGIWWKFPDEIEY